MASSSAGRSALEVSSQKCIGPSHGSESVYNCFFSRASISPAIASFAAAPVAWPPWHGPSEGPVLGALLVVIKFPTAAYRKAFVSNGYGSLWSIRKMAAGPCGWLVTSRGTGSGEGGMLVIMSLPPFIQFSLPGHEMVPPHTPRASLLASV